MNKKTKQNKVPGKDAIHKDPLRITLESAGFLTDGEPVEGLIDSDKAEKNYRIALRHKLISDEIPERTKIDLVYETPATLDGRPGHPCIYFKILNDEQDIQEIKQIRKDVWNAGIAPLLWLISPTKVQICDAFARPDEDTHILKILKITSEGLKGAEEFKRELFDTGKFWKDGIGKTLDPNQRVEKSLLDDLWDTEKVLTRDNVGLPVHIAHAILGRCIFMAYLWDRRDSKIITPEVLKNFGCEDIKELLKNKEQIYNFFRWLRKTFNGDLFPIYDNEENIVKEDTHLKLVRLFFEGAIMSSIKFDKRGKIKKGHDTRLWPYNFEIIPIELISSIYEMFAHSNDPTDARAKSIHYTKLHLVELVQSLAMPDLSDDARILDPACGSGVFLVDAFRRIVWKKKIESGRDLNREEIREILLNQIYGVDVEPGAVEVTAFSLYLALLELSEVVECKDDFKFPKLIYNPEKWNENYPPTLYKQDICNPEHVFNENEPFKSTKFDLIVGNLPWTKLRENTAPRDPEDHESGRQWILEYCNEKNIYRNHPDQAIMIRVKDFARPDTKIAFIISSRIFYQQEKAAGNFWLNSFLKENSVELVFNLSDLSDSKILFGDKKGGAGSPGMPASIIIYKPQTPKTNSCITYICPKWYSGIKRRENIIIHPPDIQTISNNLLIENPHLWKIAFRGTQRDFELIQKCYKFTLKTVLNKIEIPKNQYSKGYDRGSKYNEGDFSEYFSLPNLEENNEFKYFIDSKILPPFSYKELGRKRNLELFRGPLLIFRRSLKENETISGFTPNDTIFSNMFVGVSFYNKEEWIAHRINAILNTKLGLYFAFLLGDSFGWHYRMIEQKDWLNIPLPESLLDLEDDRWNEVIAIENKLCETWGSAPSSEIENLENALFKSVCDLYGLNKNERIVINDTINYTIDHFLNRKKKNAPLRSTKYPTLDKLEKYANRLCKQLNGMMALDGKKLIYQLYEVGEDSPLTVVEFKQTSRTTTRVNEPKKVEGIDAALSDLSQNMKKEIVGKIYALAHLRVYEGERLYMIKPSEERFWSESAALNDADEIIRDHMGGENGTS
ncbi:MAG: hypothetical protein A7316_10120 [Candidatus Altiarchaeales archaeon WOR_SM1_86-2]|nr:MAG: hypothetical protein A7316_10120 [Candidatus Altiarchaeales archaeon WOR_SM1_86-2]ODS38286.1 MAG: hypothetical protein A7315_12655 [Candidatus Altiarchaeales archaeon WOR_SM1_79]